MFRGYLTGRPYPRDTRENQLSPSVMTLCELPAKTPLIFNFPWVFTLSLTHNTYNEIPHNTGYIRLNIITIKFSTELKPTQNSCKLQLYKNGQTQKKFDIGNLFIFLSRPRETPHLERERAHTFFFFLGACCDKLFWWFLSIL